MRFAGFLLHYKRVEDTMISLLFTI
jgi:hypothetical protein